MVASGRPFLNRSDPPARCKCRGGRLQDRLTLIKACQYSNQTEHHNVAEREVYCARNTPWAILSSTVDILNKRDFENMCTMERVDSGDLLPALLSFIFMQCWKLLPVSLWNRNLNGESTQTWMPVRPVLYLIKLTRPPFVKWTKINEVVQHNYRIYRETAYRVKEHRKHICINMGQSDEGHIVVDIGRLCARMQRERRPGMRGVASICKNRLQVWAKWGLNG